MSILRPPGREYVENLPSVWTFPRGIRGLSREKEKKAARAIDFAVPVRYTVIIITGRCICRLTLRRVTIMLVNATEMLQKARDGHYAVGQFNINNLEWTKAALQAAEELQSPIILGVSEGA